MRVLSFRHYTSCPRVVYYRREKRITFFIRPLGKNMRGYTLCGGGTLNSAQNFGNSQLFQQSHMNHQQQMIKITNLKLIENHLFSKPRIRLLLISE